MRLDALVRAAPGLAARLEGDGSVDVHAVVIDSRRVAPGSLFCCIRGERADGHDLATAAVAAGAVALAVEHPVDADVPQVVVADTRTAAGPLAAALHGNPSQVLTVVGVTGTNGKTTVTHVLGGVLEAGGLSCEIIGTLRGVADDAPPTTPDAPPTTPDAPDLQALLARARDDGRDAVAMEVSSHALVHGRVAATRFAATVFTNLGHDHLDFHGTTEAYFAAKAALFTPRYTDLAVVNLDDAHGRLLAERADVRTVGYSLADASALELAPGRTTFVWRDTPMTLHLGGRFNVSNAIAAATVAAELGISTDNIAAGIAAVTSVRGRYERVDAGQAFTVVVDYAHTPDALAALLDTAREAANGGRVIVVFGAGGDKDRGKRPEMGEVASGRADRVVLTSDNPRSEDPLAIIDAVRTGVAAGADVHVEPDRRQAIGIAIADARPGDVVVIAGKGHETYQEVAGVRHPFDDVAVARELLGAAT